MPLEANAFGNAFEFLLILGFDVGPQHFAARLAVELPIALGGVEAFELADSNQVGNFRGEQTAVLIADLRRRSLEMNVGPAPALKAIAGRCVGKFCGKDPVNGDAPRTER